MPTASAGKGGDFKIPAIGNRPAVCFAIVALGTQERSFQGQAKTPAPHVRIGFELCGENDCNDDGSRVTIWTKSMMLNLGDKAGLRILLDSWRGVPFTAEDLENFEVARVLGAPCLLNVVHNTSSDGKKTYANIKSAASLVKGMLKPAPGRKQFVYEIEHGRNDAFEGLPEFIKKEILASAEAIGRIGAWSQGKLSDADSSVGKPTDFGGPDEPDDSDEVPF